MPPDCSITPTRGRRDRVHAENRHGARVRPPVSLTDLDGRGLARPVRPQHRGDGAAASAQAESVYRGRVPVPLDEITDLDGGRITHAGEFRGTFGPPRRRPEPLSGADPSPPRDAIAPPAGTDHRRHPPPPPRRPRPPPRRWRPGLRRAGRRLGDGRSARRPRLRWRRGSRPAGCPPRPAPGASRTYPGPERARRRRAGAGTRSRRGPR